MYSLPIVLADFRPLALSPAIPQEKMADYLAWMMAAAKCVQENVTSQEEAERVYTGVRDLMTRYGVSSQHISQRQLNIVPRSVANNPKGLRGTGRDMPELPAMFLNLLEDPRGDPWDKRLQLFDKVVGEYLEEAYRDVTPPPDHLVHVTCSGYLSPSPVQKLVSRKNWLNTTVTHSYHMGCYGAFPAVRMAAGFIAASHFSLARPRSKAPPWGSALRGTSPKPSRRVDIVHTEFLSIHLNTLNHAPGDIITMTLFGDGFIKYSALSLDEAKRRNLRGLKILAAQEKILPDSVDDMTWMPGPYQFDMSLSKYVPGRIQEAIMPLVTALCDQADVNFALEKERMIFAAHPGGPKILDYVRDRLGIEERQVCIVRKVLYEHGNMSSATIPHAWKEIVEDDDIPVGTKVVSAAFGPGLTATGLLLEKV